MPASFRSVGTVVLVAGLLALTSARRALAQMPADTTARVEIWAIEHNAHSPCSLSTFAHVPADGPTFTASGGPIWDGCLDVTWALACTEAGLVAACTLAGVPDWYQWGRYTWLEMELACTIAVATPTEVTATRAFDAGEVHLAGTHDVFLTAPDGTETSLFGTDPDAASGSRLLDPGNWRIAIDVQAVLTDQNLMEYTGFLEVTWSSPVHESGRAWGGLKSLYR